ncbi:MAG TPA: bifunctional riboflavin kinase/FAD synthetase [Paracoccaceae bacterium]|nr:bifunctional riboflavin kinase/FAD synthetase [Paracoccaceae bacterium]
MRIIRTFEGLEAADRGAAVAMGNFDGVHRGHRSVIELAREEAAKNGWPLGIITFEPHPRSFFAPEAPPFRLMNAEARAHRLEMLGVALLYELVFDARLASMSAETFAAEVLARGLGVAHVVVGNDFRFGKGRQGDVAALAALGRRHGFGVTAARLVANGGTDLSSTAIRRALSEGRPEEAAQMLGHWHRIEGQVETGDRRGRLLGFPTANLSLEGLHLPRFGVYAVGVDVLEGPHRGHYPGAASIGTRPTFGENRPNLEVHLLDFAGDLYDAHMSVALVAFLRPELRFPSTEALIAQMAADCAEARRILATAPRP